MQQPSSGLNTVIMLSHLRFLRRSIPATSLTSRRLHSAALTQVPNTPAKSNKSSVNQSFSPFTPKRDLSTAVTRHINTQSFTESLPSPSVHHHCQVATMATMSAAHGHSKACCNIPPIVSSGYVPQGTYEQLGGMKTYMTGPADATKGLVSIFDIFGYFDQTLQGADILATSNEHQKHKVFIPDWFKGHPVPTEWYPPDTEEKQKQLGEWFGNNDPDAVAAALPEYVKALQAAYPSIKSWGILGYCWGGKVVELVTSASSNPFAVAAAAHPALIDPTRAEKTSVPYILLASGEDPADTVKEFESKLKVPHHVETFADQVHGWMAARGDLSNPRVKEEYARGYKTLLDFFGKQWQ